MDIENRDVATAKLREELVNFEEREHSRIPGKRRGIARRSVLKAELIAFEGVFRRY